jgi:asparagine synthase (glutamine-hydrolysing)
MCGISGVLLLNGSHLEAPTLLAQTRVLAHRGPDGDGHWTNPSGTVGLGHRRLAIIDLSDSGRQPMHYRARYTITYNGEIYNYLELRAEMAGRGCTFATHSDTEVLLAAYAELGEACLGKLDGMFAFAIWDEQEQTLFCARDRFGEKPFYYSFEPGRRFVFASEMKALFIAGVDRRFDERSLYQYLAHDVVQDPAFPDRTFYVGVSCLEPAHALTVSRDRAVISPRRYWQIGTARAGHDLGFAEAAEEFRRLLSLSVGRRLRSDVPVGSSLSGGMDSSTIVCLMRQLRDQDTTPQNTFSARFHDPRLDEGRFMQLVTDTTGAHPFVVWPDAEGLAANLERMVVHHEEPFGSANPFAQWEVMRLAREHGTKVLLDGQGADETLAGYMHFFHPHLTGLFLGNRRAFAAELKAYELRFGRRFPTGWRFFVEALAPRLLRTAGSVRRAFVGPAVDWLSPELAKRHHQARPPFRTFDSLDAALRFFTLDYGLRNLLRYADRSSMAFGREVRLPFLSHELVEFLFSLPDDYKLHEACTKRILREAMAGVLPDAIRLRVDKLGFETPQQAWLEAPAMVQLVSESARALAREGLIARTPVPKEVEWRVLMVGTLLRVRPEALPA